MSDDPLLTTAKCWRPFKLEIAASIGSSGLAMGNGSVKCVKSGMRSRRVMVLDKRREKFLALIQRGSKSLQFSSGL